MKANEFGRLSNRDGEERLKAPGAYESLTKGERRASKQTPILDANASHLERATSYDFAFSASGASMHKITIATSLVLIASSHASAQSLSPEDAQILVPIRVQGTAPPDATGDTVGTYHAPVTSIATKSASSPLAVPQSISVITQQRIRDQNIRTTGEALQQIPGVGNAANAEGGFNIRGFSPLTAVDGVPSPGLVGRTAPDIAVFDRIEVLKGPGGLFAGGGAPGGVVNYVLKHPLDHPYLEMTGGAGTDWSKVAGIDASGPLSEDRRVRGRWVAYGDYRDEYVDVERHRRMSLYGVTDVDLTPSTGLSLGYYQQTNHAVQSFRQGLPTYQDGGLLDVSNRTSLTQDWSRFHFKAHWALADVTQQLGDRWAAKASFRDGGNRAPSWYSSVPYRLSPVSACGDQRFDGVVRGDPGGGRECMTTSFYNDVNKYTNVDAYLAGHVSFGAQEHDVVVGGTWQRYTFARQLADADPAYDFLQDVLHPDPHVIDAPPRVPIDPPSISVTRNKGLYGRVTLNVASWLQIPLGGRLSWVREASTGTLANRKFTPYIGLVGDIDGHWKPYVSYTTIFDTEDLSRRWSPEDANGVLLPLQSGHQYEAGLKTAWFDGALMATVAAYSLSLDNTTREDTAHAGFSVATGRQRTRGAETEVQGALSEHWDLGVAYAVVDARYVKADVGQGDRVANTPRQSFNLFTNYRWTRGPLAGVSLGGGIRVTSFIEGEVPRGEGAPRVRAPGYASLSLRAGYRVNESLDVTINVDNVSDRRYWTELGSVTSGNYLGPGRTAMATVRYRL
ncbi:TonB-dependent siderophore receptor [Luteibacter sp. CQ10]